MEPEQVKEGGVPARRECQSPRRLRIAEHVGGTAVQGVETS